MIYVRINGTLKSLRETLCLAQAALGQMTPGLASVHIDRLGELINDIDRQRPLGPNGKHGNLHTEACGCD